MLRDIKLFAEETRQASKRYCLKLTNKGGSVVFWLGTPVEDERNEWIAAILQAICNMIVQETTTT